MAPDRQTIEAAVASLYEDAARRHDEADRLRQAALCARNLQLSQRDLSAPADWVGMVAAYQDLQRHVTDLLEQATTMHERIRVALRTAADGYLDDETAAVHQLRGIW